MAKDLEHNRLVAVKRIANPFCKGERAKCCFRELHLLRSLHHPNVPSLPPSVRLTLCMQLIALYDAFLDTTNHDLYVPTCALLTNDRLSGP